MTEIRSADAIIDFCLAPLSPDGSGATEREVRRRMAHVIKTYQARIPQPVAVDFTAMPPLVINEAAHGYE